MFIVPSSDDCRTAVMAMLFRIFPDVLNVTIN